jgi:hypothetical protein
LADTLGLVPVAGSEMIKGELPSLLTVTVCGLSLLVEPTTVLAKVSVGVSVKSR